MNKKIIVLEIGRPIIDDVKKQIGEPVEVVSIKRAISENEIPAIVKEAYSKIRKHSDSEIHLVLSGPLGLAFTLGQAVGLSHYKIKVYQFSQGKYVEIPELTREELF